MTSNFIRLAMIGYQPTIKNHQTKEKHKQDKNVLTIVPLYL